MAERPFSPDSSERTRWKRGSLGPGRAPPRPARPAPARCRSARCTSVPTCTGLAGRMPAAPPARPCCCASRPARTVRRGRRRRCGRSGRCRHLRVRAALATPCPSASSSTSGGRRRCRRTGNGRPSPSWPPRAPAPVTRGRFPESAADRAPRSRGGVAPVPVGAAFGKQEVQRIQYGQTAGEIGRPGGKKEADS